MKNKFQKVKRVVEQNELKQLVSCLKTLKILYVEDNEESRIQALKMLKNYFSFIDVAVDGANGLECYKNHFIDTNSYYDLIITDIQMPNIDGISMSKAIYDINKNQKILIVSAYSDKKYFINLIVPKILTSFCFTIFLNYIHFILKNY